MGVRSPGKRGNVTLIHPMSRKSQILKDEVLQRSADKYVITYQNIWGEGVVKLHLVKSSYCKMLVLLKSTSSFNHALHEKKKFVNSCSYTKNNFKNAATYKNFLGEEGVRPLGKRGSVTSIHLISYKYPIYADEI